MSIDCFLGDCYDVLKDFYSNGLKVDTVIADIPYNISIADWDNDFDLRSLIPYIKNILKENGNLVLFSGYSTVLHTKEILDENFIFKNWIIYDRIKGRGCKNNFMSTREDILWYVNGNGNYTFNKIDSNIPKKNKGFWLEEW